MTDLLKAFDVSSSSTSVIVLYVAKAGTKSRLKAKIYEKPADWKEQGQTDWGYAPFECWGDEKVTLLALLTHLMYGLDYERAEEEWRKLPGSKA